MLFLICTLLFLAVACAQLPTECGVPVIPPNLSSRIVGGHEAVPHSWPWQVQVRYAGVHLCGASVLSDQYILTAAHCTNGLAVRGLSLRAGRHTLSAVEASEQVAEVQTVWQHENYNAVTLANDVALIRLRSPLTYNTNVQPVCLPNSEVTQPGEPMYAVGWGDVQGTCCGDVLKQVMLPLVDRATCSGYYGSSVDQTMLCAGFKLGDNICFGDSGGPLVFHQNGRWLLQGVASWVSDLVCNQGGPAVFTDVWHFDSWIRSKIVALETEQASLKRRSGFAFRKRASAH